MSALTALTKITSIRRNGNSKTVAYEHSSMFGGEGEGHSVGVGVGVGVWERVVEWKWKQGSPQNDLV